MNIENEVMVKTYSYMKGDQLVKVEGITSNVIRIPLGHLEYLLEKSFYYMNKAKRF